MSRRGWLILVGSLFLPGLLCVEAFVLFHKESPRPRPIPDGVYRPATGDELVAIEGDRIRFVVHDVVHGRDPAPTDVVVKEYDYYSVYPDRALEAGPMTSAEALGGPVGRYEWSWDGTAITRRSVLEKGQRPADLEPPKIFRRAVEPPPN